MRRLTFPHTVQTRKGPVTFRPVGPVIHSWTQADADAMIAALALDECTPAELDEIARRNAGSGLYACQLIAYNAGVIASRKRRNGETG